MSFYPSYLIGMDLARKYTADARSCEVVAHELSKAITDPDAINYPVEREEAEAMVRALDEKRMNIILGWSTRSEKQHP